MENINGQQEDLLKIRKKAEKARKKKGKVYRALLVFHSSISKITKLFSALNSNLTERHREK
jgi:hypothetical protein